MSQDWENLLISKVLATSDILTAIDHGITEDFFSDDQHRRAWGFIRDQWATYGKVPTVQTFRGNFPRETYRLIDAREEPYDLIVERVRYQRRLALAMILATDINKRLSEDEPDLKELLKVLASSQMAMHAQTGTTQDVDLDVTGQERWDYYKNIESREGIIGIPTGLPTIDEATAGLQPEQLVTLIGTPKSQKSVWAMRIARNIRIAGYVPLFIGFEMSNKEQSSRYDAMAAGIDHHALITGTLTRAQKNALRDALDEDRRGIPFILSADRERNMTISGVKAKIEQYKPDVVFIDGSYLMEDENRAPEDWRRMTNITRGLKKLAQQAKLPIFNTTQALTSKYNKRVGLQQDTIGYTSGYAQDSDVVLGIEHTDMDDVQILSIVIARNARPVKIDVRCDWKNGLFEEIGEHDPSVAASARDDDPYQ